MNPQTTPWFCSHCGHPNQPDWKACQMCHTLKKPLSSAFRKLIITGIVLVAGLGFVCVVAVLWKINARQEDSLVMTINHDKLRRAGTTGESTSGQPELKALRADARDRWMERLGEEIQAQDRMASIRAREKEKCIYITYKFVTIDDAAQDFLRQRRETGIKELINAGFEKVRIEANTEDGKAASREILLTEYLAGLKKNSPPSERCE